MFRMFKHSKNVQAQQECSSTARMFKHSKNVQGKARNVVREKRDRCLKDFSSETFNPVLRDPIPHPQGFQADFDALQDDPNAWNSDTVPDPEETITYSGIFVHTYIHSEFRVRIPWKTKNSYDKPLLRVFRRKG
jgi:hypothetical protein